MISGLLKKLFGTSNDRIVKSLQPIVQQINAYESELEKLSDEQLQQKTPYFKKILAEGATLEEILPEAFAVVREASRRTLGLRHFDVQMIGGIILHRGMIAEMKTGEGKTLVATLPLYLNALTGRGAHLVTINDYLAKRDSEWMGEIYQFLGLSVGCITNSLDDMSRKSAYDADITYGTNNEFGFDYLRDNLKYDQDEMVQREFNFAIVDEVDSILVDEARTPLIISGPTDDNSKLYVEIDRVIPDLATDDYEVDEKSKNASLTDKGNLSIEELLKKANIIARETGLYDYENISVVHYVNQALKAHKIFKKDVDYIVKDGKVMIIDEFTGRILEGRRYSEGLHQAIEAKERVGIQNENQTLASITFQNYFRMFPKLAGMTGTAMTEAAEFSDIYKLEVISIPTNITVKRVDEDDEIYLTEAEKFNAIIEEIKQANQKKQPVLVGTASIDKSEHLSALLKKMKIKHNVLNARYHQQEAEIIAQAGQPGAVTIATNMAGRGTDIKLGGNAEMMLSQKLATLDKASAADMAKYQVEFDAQVERQKDEVIAAGGLLVIGSERHESRRIDNQLRGRSGRQGDPGRTKFYLSMEDDLMRVFGSDKIKGLLSKLGLNDGEAITHPLISRSLEKAQQKVEARNYDIRKNLLKFDDVMNDQRKVVYDQRKFIMSEQDLHATFVTMVDEICQEIVSAHIPVNSLPEEWDADGLDKEIFRIFSLHLDAVSLAKKEGVAEDEILETLRSMVVQHFATKRQEFGDEMVNNAEKHIMLLTLDQLWKDHLHTLDHLRTGIGLRAYAQKDPLNEYKIEAFNLFKVLLDNVALQTVERMAHIEIRQNIEQMPKRTEQARIETRLDSALQHFSNPEDVVVKTNVRPVRSLVSPEDRNPNDPSSWGKISRNENCPCGSGKKYKHCHGIMAA